MIYVSDVVVMIKGQLNLMQLKNSECMNLFMESNVKSP